MTAFALLFVGVAVSESIVYERPPLTDYQAEAFFNPSRIALVEGATKTGKNHTGMAWLFEQAIIRPIAMNYWWLDPVYPQAAIAYRRLKDAIPVPLRKPNDSDMTLTLPNKRVLWFKSGEKPDNLYGEDVGAAVINEASRFREESWHAVRSTLTYTRGPLRIIGNVKGRLNWFYRLCRKAQAGEPNMIYRRFISAQAVATGILDQEEIDGARRDLPEKVFKELYEAEASDDGSNPFGLQHIAGCVAPLSGKPSICYGVDLAKHVDWSVVLGLDFAGHTSTFERFQKPWEETITAVKSATGESMALVDSTGVGDPILERLQREKPGRYEGFHFSAPSKQRIIEGLAVGIQGRRVHFPDGPIRHELDSFEYEYTRTGVRYTAPEGMHDDCVYALALAWSLWSGKASHHPSSVWTGAGGVPVGQRPSWDVG